MTDRSPPPAFEHSSSVAGVRSYFDAFAQGEWDRLDSSLAGQVSFEVHRRFLTRFVTPGMRVLEIGAGPGRFTIELARLGARVVVTDISPVQLELNERYVSEAGCAAAVERRELTDICDLSRYRDAEFDAVVAYGGPLSYAFDRAGFAVQELLRVIRPGAPAVASVMSTIGGYRHLLRGVVGLIERFGDDVNDRVLATGDLRETQPPGTGHTCKMFRWPELVELVTYAGGRMLAASASNWASLGDPDALQRLAAQPERWGRFLDHEVRLCAEPGVLDGSTHILFAAASS
ncbi:MAG: class I SAM-dependent methyltransferase, partial [Actinomycetota bacterium]|nr:class I SAM-dependent methyltransferase [Actinomycetota bacterium]